MDDNFGAENREHSPLVGPSEPRPCRETDLLPPWPDHPDQGGCEAGGNEWLPIVLSLDGGGIRGLSSLIILKNLMEKVRREEERYGWKAGYENLRPCHYFDFFVGTSTGGLIAVMLGRLRMGIDECINEYKSLGTLVFGRRRLRPWYPMTKYHDRYLEEAIKSVVMNHCQEHHHTEKCTGTDLLRQYDFSHREGKYKNYTCKVALVACREKLQGGDDTYLFRSYDHVEATPTRYNLHDDTEFNPGLVQLNQTRIWEACRATSAAPFYFHKTVIEGSRYMDGGVGRNNPAGIAWHEASQMAERASGKTENPLLLVSIGTGRKKESSRFGSGYGPFPYRLLMWTKNLVSNTEDTHKEMKTTSKGGKTPYFRFNVNEGLEKMKLDECKKKHTQSVATRLRHAIFPAKSTTKTTEPTANGVVMVSGQSTTRDQLDPNDLTSNAEPSRQHDGPDVPPSVTTGEVTDTRGSKKAKLPKGSYKPQKYLYETYEKIEADTNRYCNIVGTNNKTIPVEKHLEASAQFLVYYRRRRERYDERWKLFACHPYRRIEESFDGLSYD